MILPKPLFKVVILTMEMDHGIVQIVHIFSAESVLMDRFQRVIKIAVSIICLIMDGDIQ